MRINITLKISNSIIGCLLLFSAVLNGQAYSFKNYSAESNIPSSFVYTINQSTDGFLWVGTVNGIFRFDGFNFFTVQYPDSVIGRYPTVSLKDKSGKLWFGCSDGSVFFVRDNRLIAVSLSNTKSISDLLEGPDGFVYIVPQQGKAVYSVNSAKPEEIHKYSFSVDPTMFSGLFTKNGLLLIGTQGNLLMCSLANDSVKVVSIVEGFNYSIISAIHQTSDSSRFVIGTTDNGLFQLKVSEKGNSLTRFHDHPGWDSLNIQSISEDSDHYMWISTMGSGAIQIKFSDNYESINSVRSYNLKSGLTSNNIKTVFQDLEGNYWFGFSGEGISMLSSNNFMYYKPGKNSVGNNIIYINSLNDKYLLGTPSGFHVFDQSLGKSISFTDLTGQIGKAEITCYYLDEFKNLWIGTAGKGLYVRTSSGAVRLFHRSGDSGADDIKDIEMDARNIWLATTNGVFVIDRNSTDIRREKRRFDIEHGLPHNSINKILLAHDGYAYIGTESDKLYKIDNRFYKIDSELNTPVVGNAIMVGNAKNKILSFSESKNGEIWVATSGNGVFKYFNDTVIAINRTNDLMSNYCYSILADAEKNIWIGHEKGFSRFNPETETMSVFGTDFAKGGICNVGGMFESADRKIFIGTTEGLIIYDRLKDNKNENVPINNINYITINDVTYPYQQLYTLPYLKKYVIRVFYSGINFSSPDKVYYSTFLENYDNDWSKMSTQKEVEYSLSYGKYKFKLISVNKEGLSQETPVTFDIIIKKPIYKTWWFILLSIGGISGIVIFIIRERDKAQKKVQAYLEKELELRTSVVIKQKEEIELQNIGITDSINYAKRIQSSILPDVNKLKESFHDAFVFFHPRDIVSGDFYWFEKLEDDKFVIVCADSTGHGVPGAFMSMIGSTLLQDIVSRKRISKPSKILELLDKQIFSTLNQNQELGVSNDGMDVVVCEFNTKTRHLRFASAMRPVIIVIDGEPFYIKGNRSSIGGESAIEKFFDDQEYYLNKGDTVYLFSDGLPDQFGGVDGKKMKIARLKHLIEQVSKLPMYEQKEAIAKFFFDWKGNYDQVDDILIMGIKV